MSYRIPGGHPVQKPTRSARIDGRHPLATQLAGAWLIPELLRPVGDGVDAWHYRIDNGVDDNYARVEGSNSFSVGPRGTVLNFLAGQTPITAAWIPAAPAIHYGTPMSLFCRARIPAMASWRWLVAKVTGSWLGIDAGGHLSWTVGPGNNNLSSAVVADGGWHTVGMTLLGSNLQLYVDGAPDNSYSGIGITVSVTDTFWGHRGDWIEQFTGDIEWVYQWHRALTAADVVMLQENPYGLYQTNPLGRYYTIPPPPAAVVPLPTAVLIEDGDGILPSGNVTADLTPSLSWNSLNQPGLQAYYQFESVPGILADSGPNGWNLAVTQGAVTTRAGAGHGGAWALQTSVARQSTLTRAIGNVAALNGSAVSVEGWYLWKGSNNAGSSILPFYGAASAEYMPRLLIENALGTTTLRVRMFTLASGVTTVATVAGLVQDSAWHHAAMTYDAVAGRCCVYNDGALALSVAVPPTAIAVAANAANRIELDVGDYALDECALYSTVLSASVVGAHFRVGGGPFLYGWKLRAGTNQLSGTVVASGSLVNQTFVQIRPAQRPGPYTFELSVRDASGASGATTAYGFTLIDGRFLKAPRLISLPPFDVAPVVPDPPEYLRYLPQWLSCFGTATAPPSGALLYRVMAPVIRQLQGVATAGQDLLDGAGLASVPLNLPRLAWHLRTTLRPEDPITFRVQASGDVRPLRRAASMKQFLEADDPICLVGETGHVVFRNLALRQVTLSPVSGSTGATGSVLATLSSQYQIPFEGAGMVPDANVLFQSPAGTPGGGAWYRIRGGSAAIDPAYATIQLSPSLSGSLTFQYQSATYASALQVAVSGQPWRIPGAVDLWNRFDEIALLADMRRRNGEDNVSLARRLTVRLLTPPGTDPRACAMAIAADLQLVDLLPWDGQSILDLAGSGYIGVRGVTVPGLRATDHVEDRLVGNGAQLWTGAKRAWLPGWQVRIDGRPAGPASYPGMAVSGNTLNFGVPVSGVILAHYQYANYRFDVSGQQAITRVVPVSGNVPSGDYRVLLNQGVQLSQPSDPDVQNRKLLNADGTPNPLFFLLQQELLNESPIHVARARWGGDAYWVPPAGDQPLVDHLPAVFDRFTP